MMHPKNLRALLNERYGKDTKGFIFKKKLRYTERILGKPTMRFTCSVKYGRKGANTSSGRAKCLSSLPRKARPALEKIYEEMASGDRGTFLLYTDIRGGACTDISRLLHVLQCITTQISPKSPRYAFAKNCKVLPMPLYKFQCTDCENPSELLVRSSDLSGEKMPALWIIPY